MLIPQQSGILHSKSTNIGNISESLAYFLKNFAMVFSYDEFSSEKDSGPSLELSLKDVKKK